MNRPTLVVVGGGILGTMHAIEGVERGYEVFHLERDPLPRGASVRNFGLVWVSGRAEGRELELALEARERWGRLGGLVPGLGFRANGSLTCARNEAELAAITGAAEAPGATARGLRLLSVAEAREINPGLGGDFLGALFCELDAAVEPRLALGALREYLSRSGSYHFLPGTEVREVTNHGVVDHRGTHFEGDRVICCIGASFAGPFAAALEHAPLRRVRLQMLETSPVAEGLTASVADGDSLRYYPAFAPFRHLLEPQSEPAATWRAQLLLVRRLSGHLTIGDTHGYDEPFPFDIADEPTGHFVAVATALLGRPLPPVERRWAGVYCETTAPGELYLRLEVEPGVEVVTGPGGRGMTLSPAIAAESFR